MKLQTQFALAFIPLLGLAALGTTVAARKAVHKVLLEEMAGRGQTVLEGIAASTVPGLESGQEDLLLPILTSALAREGAAYVIVLDTRGRVVAHTNVLEKGNLYTDPITSEALKASETRYHEVPSKPVALLDVSWPVWSPEKNSSKTSNELFLLGAETESRKRLGTLRMGLSLERAQQTEQRIARQLGLLLALFDTLLLGLAFFLVRSILQPVQHLALATDDISQGMFGAVVPVPSASELANLARSFNRMSEVLAQTTISKEFFNTILDKMPDPLIILNPQKRFRIVNPAAAQLLETSSEVLAGQDFESFWDERNPVSLAALELGTLHDIKIRLKTRSGKSPLLICYGWLLKDHEEKHMGFIIALRVAP